ncbi:MAG: tetratricopeptide repeat protein [bacterium]
MKQNLQRKETESGQGFPDNRESRKKYQELLEKAEKLFQKEKFGSAKHHFGQAYQIWPSEEVQRRIHICEENAQRMARAQDLVREGYQLEREKKLREALKVFHRSLEAWDNKEIRAVVTRLLGKIPKPTLAPGYQAEADHRYAEAIERYREVMELEENPEARHRIGICLVKQGAYAEAVRFLESTSSQEPEARYYAGYALARTGQYSKALRQWESISQDTPELARQKQHLLEIALCDLRGRSRIEGGFDAAYQEAVDLLSCCPDPLVRASVRSMSLEHLEHLWTQGNFKAMLDFLLSLQSQGGYEDFLPFFLAKVYFRLAETAAEYLPQAITFWLTVIYNPKYQLPSGPPAADDDDRRQMTGDLQDKLEQLIQHYKTSQGEEGLKEILSHWELERQSITFLHEAAHKEPSLAEILCTPDFAGHFGLSPLVLERLREVRSEWETDERFWTVGALFSSARSSYLLLHQGRLEEAMAALPAQEENEFIGYCRQKIFFRLGMKKLHKGETTNLKKYFTQAIPLIQRFQEYEKEIIQLAQKIEAEPEELVALDEVMQILVRHIKSREILDMASYIMSYKANTLHAKGLIKAQDVERICRKALDLNPDNEFARTGLREMESQHLVNEMARALGKGNVKKAAAIAASAQNEEIEEVFFDFVDTVLDEFDNAPLSREKKIFFLRDLYQNCEKVDPDHPVLDDILDELEDLEREVE